MVYFVIFGIIGVGLGLFFGGRSTGSFLKKISGGAFILLGICLLALMFMAEAKKAGVI
jgi:preprotein translocase subunit SecG